MDSEVRVYADLLAHEQRGNQDSVITDKELLGGTLGWRDVPLEIIVRGIGNVSPTWSQMGASPFWAYKFGLNNECWGNAHLQHDFALNSGIYFHVHFTTSGIDTQPVVFEFTWSAAKGHNQSNYDMTGAIVTSTVIPHGSAWRHYVAEIAAPVSSTEFEPDTIIRIRLRRITNGGVNNADDVFVDFMDMHYQVDRLATLNRAPNFYGA